jgi:broad specificity phosphatase PhoE
VRVFLLARHGQSLFNVDGIVNGDPLRDRGLSERGIEEAERLGVQISTIAIDVVVLSPFPRAVQTANIALARREVPHEVDDDLGDIRLGELDGWSVADYRAYKCHGNRDVRFPGGESLNEAARRYAGAYERLLTRSERVMLVVCHEIPLRYALNAAAGSDDLDGPAHLVANAVPYLFDAASLERAAARIESLVGGASAA